MRILYLSSILPKRSETFVYREIIGLREIGIAVETASLYRPESGLGDPGLDEMAIHSIPVYGTGMPALILDAAVFAVRSPLRALRLLGLALTDAVTADDLPPVGRLKVVPQAIAALALAHRVSGRGLTHIHVHMAHAATTVGMYAASALNLPFSFTGHAADIFRERGLLRQKLSRAAFVACISNWHRAWYAQIYPRPDDDYPVIRCGVDVPTAPADPGKSDSLRIVSLGRMVPKKGFDALVDAVRELHDRNVPVHATIAGDGPELANLKALAKSLPVDFPGPIDNRAVPALLAGADVFALPCRISTDGDRDGIPVVLMEAMAHGVCCVSGDLPTIRELIENHHSGLLIPPGDAGALSEALAALAGDPTLRARLAENGRLRVKEEFSSTENIAKIIRSFEAYQTHLS